MKYVLVSGGVISGIGKGVIASSAGLLLKTIGLKISLVTSIKIDPYMNVDAGTMSPTEHGEVFVLDDGGEVDLDLGNYERYLNITLTRANNITTGKVYQHVIEKERRGDYLGRTVQVVPHVTDAITDWIQRVAQIPVDDTGEVPDVCIVELGGTVGDIESGPFIEAMRSLRRRAGRGNFLQIHVSLVPIVGGEQKTKPTQQAIKDARSAGLSPDLIACRCPEKLLASSTDKIAHFCQVELDQVIAVHDVASTYHVPMLLEEQGLVTSLRDILKLDQLPKSDALIKQGKYTWKQWKTLATAQDRLFDSVTIALVGKYTNLHDSYLSVIKSLEHAAMHCRRKLNLVWVNAEELEQPSAKKDPAKFHKAWHQLCTADGIIVPGGFGYRGTEGMIAAAKWARENKTPYLGICLGMQLAVVEFARNVAGIEDALSSEFVAKKESTNGVEGTTSDKVEEKTAGSANQKPTGEALPTTENEVIVFMPEVDKTKLGGTMRLGLRPTMFQPGTEWSTLRSLYSASSAPGAFAATVPASPTLLAAKPAIPASASASTAGGEVVTETSTAAPAVWERHRHRYEVNPAYIERLAAAGLAFVGRDETGARMEIIELDRRAHAHPFYVGVQYHPEYLSRVLKPSVPYLGLVAASCGILDDFKAKDGVPNPAAEGVLDGAVVPTVGLKLPVQTSQVNGHA